MKILLITQLFPADADAKYTSAALREFVVEWAKNGHEVHVFRPHFSYEQETFPNPSSFFIEHQVPVQFIKPVRIPFFKLSYYPPKRILRELSFVPDVVVCHMYNSYFSFHRLAKMLDVPLVIGIHMSDIRISRHWFHRWHQKSIFKDAAAFACRSHAYLKAFSVRFPEYAPKSFPAGSGLPEAYFYPREPRKKSKIKRLITVSRLEKRKQVDRVLKALSKIPSTFEWNYTIVGYGSEEESLKKLSIELGLQNKVFFKGQLNRSEVHNELICKDIFILPSYNETFGLVYLEAMASGCITIGSKGEGIDGIIEDGINGFLCDANSDSSIVDAILKAIRLDEIEEEKMRGTAYNTISSYSIENKAEEYLNQIKKVLA